jgi:hypothetical protein
MPTYGFVCQIHNRASAEPEQIPAQDLGSSHLPALFSIGLMTRLPQLLR